MIGGQAIIVVGGTGMGKTTFNKQCLSQVNKDIICLYDVNREYTEFLPENYVLPKFQDFCKNATALTKHVVVYEEATMFLSNKGSNELLIEQLVRKRHTENTYFLVFHSLRSVPKYLLSLCNMIVLHKTNDPLDLVEKFDCPQLTKAFTEIKNAGMLQGSSGKLYSPNKIVKLIS